MVLLIATNVRRSARRLRRRFNARGRSIAYRPVADYTYHYDSTGDVSNVEAELGGVTSDGSMVPINLGSMYDYNGNRTELYANIGGTADFDTDGDFLGPTGGTTAFVNTFDYNDVGDMTSIEQYDSVGGYKYVSLGYDADGRTLSVDDYAGSSTSAPLVAAAAYGYDGDSDLTDLVYTNGGGAIAGYHWDYNNDGLVTDEYSRNDTTACSPDATYVAGSSNWAVTSYGYDDDGQLTSTGYSSNYANAPATDASVTYDDNGNRTTNPNITSGDNTVSSATDRVLYDGTYYYTYDPAGNRTARFKNSVDGALDSNATDITIYAWNDANELTSAKHYCTFSDYQSGDSDSEVDYAYDFSGEMVQRTEGGSAENYVYDGQNLALVLNSSGGVVERELNAAAVDQVLASEDSSGNVNWLLTDNEGSVRDVVQNVYGTDVTALVDHVIYDSFGNATQGAGFTGDPLPRFGFQGMRYDATTGLNIAEHRFYDPGTGNWLSQDPLGFGGGDSNTSRFVGNSPTNGTDPSGLDCLWNPFTWGNGSGLTWGEFFNPVSEESLSTAVGFSAGWDQAEQDITSGAGTAIQQGAYYVRDVGAVGADATVMWTGNLFGKNWSLGVDNWSQVGQSYEHGVNWKKAGTNALRSGLAAGTGGGSEVVFGTADFVRTGDGRALSRHMGGVAGGNGLAIVLIKGAQGIRVGLRGRGFSSGSVPTSARRTGAYSPEFESDLSGLGKLARMKVRVSPQGLDIVKQHLSQFGDVPANAMMIQRLLDALSTGQKVSGADASFYMHEVSEATMMGRGLGYDAAHAAALAKYQVSPFSVYHPDVIQALSPWFNDNWFSFWGIDQ